MPSHASLTITGYSTMNENVDVKFFFNFRSPYCYIVSKLLPDIFDDYHVNLVWRPLGGWEGRSAPDRAKVKIPLVRQDMARITRKMGIPMNPPPPTTDPTKAGAGSLLAEERGVLRDYIVAMMAAEWAQGKDIGDESVILTVGESVGLDRDELATSLESPQRIATLEKNSKEAEVLGVIGVPTFVVGHEIFWGSDRVEYLCDHLCQLRLTRY
jgi:2-hydroxychromene-2-carboxylate isomerase